MSRRSADVTGSRTPQESGMGGSGRWGHRPWLRLGLVAWVAACGGGEVAGPAHEEGGLEVLDSLMSDFMASNDIGAGALGVMRNGQIVYQKGFGFMDPEGEAPVPGSVMMRLASVSKPVTAAVVRDLIDDGLLALDDHAFDLGQTGGGILALEPFPALGDERLRDVTIRHLLQHRGGWDREIAGDLTYRELEIAHEMDVPSPPGRERTVRYILGRPLQFAPGTEYAYANIGYLVLGLVVEAVTGEAFLDVVRERVFAPLGVSPDEVVQGRTFPEDRSPREPWYDSDAVGPSVFPPVGSAVPLTEGGWDHEARIAQGGLVASTEAMLGYLQAFQVAGDGIGTRRAGGEGAGWRWNHTGSLPGTNTLARQRGDGVSYVVLFNKRPTSGTSYAVQMRAEIDALLDGGRIDGVSEAQRAPGAPARRAFLRETPDGLIQVPITATPCA